MQMTTDYLTWAVGRFTYVELLFNFGRYNDPDHDMQRQVMWVVQNEKHKVVLQDPGWNIVVRVRKY